MKKTTMTITQVFINAMQMIFQLKKFQQPLIKKNILNNLYFFINNFKKKLLLQSKQKLKRLINKFTKTLKSKQIAY